MATTHRGVRTYTASVLSAAPKAACSSDERKVWLETARSKVNLTSSCCPPSAPKALRKRRNRSPHVRRRNGGDRP